MNYFIHTSHQFALLRNIQDCFYATSYDKGFELKGIGSLSNHDDGAEVDT